MIRERFLSIDPLKCTGCMECETACSTRHAGKKRGAAAPAFKSWVVTRVPAISISLSLASSAPSLHAWLPARKTPFIATLSPGSVLLDESCVGCKMCVSACPTGAMGFDTDLGLAYKCDLCGGDPQCARVCQPKAIEYEAVEKLPHARMIQSASKLYQAVRNQVALPGV